MNRHQHTFGPIRFMRLTAGPGMTNPPTGTTLRRWQRRIQQDLKQQLLAQAGLTGVLRYDASGKPFLAGDGYISITHFGFTAALALAPFPVGLDGETPGPRILRISRKFLHPGEIENTDTAGVEVLTRIWTAKEAVYKLVGRRGLSFARDIRVFGAAHADTGMARVTGSAEIKLRWFGRDAVFCLAHFAGDE